MPGEHARREPGLEPVCEPPTHGRIGVSFAAPTLRAGSPGRASPPPGPPQTPRAPEAPEPGTTGEGEPPLSDRVSVFGAVAGSATGGPVPGPMGGDPDDHGGIGDHGRDPHRSRGVGSLRCEGICHPPGGLSRRSIIVLMTLGTGGVSHESRD